MTSPVGRRRLRSGIVSLGAAVGAALVVVSLGACTGRSVVDGSEVRVAVAEPLTSLNASTSFGRASATNADVAHLTRTGFAFRAADGTLELDESFGDAEIIARDPLTVRYSIADGVRWSDGTPVDSADLLLAWAADSGALNDPDFDDADFVDPDTGRYRDDYPDDVVYFDGLISGGIEQAVQTPQLAGSDTIFVHFERFEPAWRTLVAPGVPAHVLARLALDLEPDADADAAKAAVVAAIEERDPTALAALSRAWNTAFDLDADPAAEPPPGAFVSSGPYVVTEVGPDGGVVFAANGEYSGERRPAFETIRLRVSPDPLESAELLRDDELDIVSPPPTEDLASAFSSLDGVDVQTGVEARFEHLDLQFADGLHGTFDDPLLREAFLLTVPRERIVDEVIRPVDPDAAVLDSFVVREFAPGYQSVVAENGSDAYAEPDLAAARALVAESGVAEPAACILFDPADPRRRAEFDLIAASAAEAGFRVSDCSTPNWESLLGVAGVYDAALFSWDTSRLGPAAVGAVFRSDSAIVNLNRYADPEVDALLDDLAVLDEHDEQLAVLAQIDALVWEDAYGLPLYSYPTLTAVSGDVENVSRSPLARGVFWNAWQWRPAPDR